MNSEDTKRIIRIIAKEEGLSEKTVRKIVLSQFEGTYKVMSSGIPGESNTFKNVAINAFGTFKIMPARIKRLNGRKLYEQEQRKRHDNKK